MKESGSARSSSSAFAIPDLWSGGERVLRSRGPVSRPGSIETRQESRQRRLAPVHPFCPRFDRAARSIAWCPGSCRYLGGRWASWLGSKPPVESSPIPFLPRIAKSNKTIPWSDRVAKRAISTTSIDLAHPRDTFGIVHRPPKTLATNGCAIEVARASPNR